MRNWGILLIVLLLLPVGFGAKVVGVIYDADLEPIKQAVVIVNTTPEQTKVSRYGGYHFFVEEGNYEISVTLTRNNITKIIAQDTISIPDTDGEISRDLFIIEGFDMTEEFKETFWTRLLRNESLGWIIAGIALVFLLILGYFYLARKRIASTSQSPPPVMSHTNLTDIEPKNPDAVLEKRILVIVKTKKRVTQKEVRREFKLSEAKISLVIQKLENDGKLVKVRQGRSNVLTIKQ